MNFYMLNRLVLIMKLSILLLFSITLQVSATGYAQKVSISTKAATLEAVLAVFSKQSGYDFIYNNFDIKGHNNISLELKNVPLEEGLNTCLEGINLTYVIKEKTIVIKRKEKTIFNKLTDLLSIAKPIKGMVLDDKGLPLIGALVKNKDGKVIATTNQNGAFTLDVPEGTYLEISYLGYKPQEIITGKNTETIAVNLIQVISKLDEISVEGYRTTSRRTATGNIATLGSEELMKQPVSNPFQAMIGRLPGVVVSQTTGVPGARLNIQIRGRANFDPFLTTDQPLFIIDGVPMAAGNNKVSLLGGPFGAGLSDGLSAFNGLNPSDIESISVLKDADATAIYGSRGANGVVMITTKTGKIGKLKMDVNFYSGVSTVTKMAKMMNTEQYIAMRKEALANDKITPNNNNAYDLLLWDNNRYTDFAKLLVGNNAHTNDAQVSFSGGTLNTQYRIGGGYNRESTVWPGDMYSDRGSMNFNLNSSSDDKKFNIAFSGNYSVSNSNLTALDLAGAMVLPPNFRLYDDNGKLAWNEGNIYLQKDNPLAQLNQQYLAKMSNLNANLTLTYKLLKNLSLKSSMGYNTTQNDEKRLTPLSAQNPMKSNLSGFAGFANNQFKNWIIEPQIEYNTQIRKGKLSILAGATVNQRTTAGQTINAVGFTSDELIGSLKSAPQTGITVGNTATMYKYQAIFGRINYNLDNKYIVNFTGRRDGSSRFGPNYRLSNFGAIGTAWLFSNEDFLKNNKILSYGKLRASYGSTGNDQIGEYTYLDSWSTAGSYTDSATLYPVRLYNPDLHWERNNKMEMAVDLGFFKDRILLTAAYYRSISSEPLVNYPLARITGFATIVQNLPGVKVMNSGLELTLSSTNISKGDFRWSSDFNISIPKNKLVKYPDLEKSSYATKYKIGESLNRIFVSQYTGVDPNTGLYTVKDVNGDNQVNAANDYYTRGSSDADFFGGLNNTFTYKRFSASFFLQFTKQIGRKWTTNNLSNPPGSIFNVPTLALDRWQNIGDQKEVQKFTTSQGPIFGTAGFYPYSFSGGGYVDASYIRLRNVSFSYDIPLKWLNVISIKTCRFYVQAQNLFVITGYKGGDPETQNYTRMSPLRTITGGLQLTL